MKTKIYTLTTDNGDDKSTQVYSSAKECDDDAAQFMQSYPDAYCNTDDHEIDLPAPSETADQTPPPVDVNAALLAAMRKAMVDLRKGVSTHRGVDRFDVANDLGTAIAQAERQATEAPRHEPTQEQMDDFPIEDWRYDVSNGDTRRGYNEWVIENAVQAAEMQEG